MIVNIYNKKNNNLVCSADILFSPGTLLVKECDNISAIELENLLMNKARFKDSLEMDDIVLKKLGLEKRKREFGRMSEACVLYAMLCNFETDDEYVLFPQEDEVLSMIAYGSEYSNIYLWRKNNDINA